MDLNSFPCLGWAIFPQTSRLFCRKIQEAKTQNWQTIYPHHSLTVLKYDQINHAVFIVSYKEPISVIELAFTSLAAQIDIDLKYLHVVLAQEARAGSENNQQTQDYFQKKYAHIFGNLVFYEHPDNLEGETRGKHSNEAWAAIQFKQDYLDTSKLDMSTTTLTTCDVDTVFHPKYFSALRYSFGTNENRHVRFWQTPMFWHNNLNEVPALTRIVGVLGNIIHIANIQEPDGLFFNYSCYSASYNLIDLAGYWDIDTIPEDWHIFLQAFFSTEGQAKVEPIFLPTLVDAPTGKTYFSALKNRYNQCLRHAWGATDIPYAIEQSFHHPEIPLSLRLARIFKLLQTHVIWSSNWFILTLGTSLPTLLNPAFFQTTIGYNLPRISSFILTICLIPLFFLILLDWKLRPKETKKGLKPLILNLIQWPLMPVATLFMSTLPGLDSHTRLLLGKRLEYKSTPKQ